jgi:hypothetical protein
MRGLCGRRPDGQHRARSHAHHPLGDAPHHEMAETGATMRRHDDQVRLLLCHDLNDLAIWRTHNHAARHLYLDVLGF